MRDLLIACVLALLLSLGVAWGQSRTFNGVTYDFPSSQGAASTALQTDGAGNLSWAAVDVIDVATFFTGGACPAGWSEVVAARGRYVVGLPSGGTNAATVGTALTNLENRAVGQHSHSVSDPTHTHTQNAHGHTLNDPGHRHTVANFENQASFDTEVPVSNVTIMSGTTSLASQVSGITVANATAGNVAATTGIAIGNTGSVTGTNMPYRQEIFCRSTGGS